MNNESGIAPSQEDIYEIWDPPRPGPQEAHEIRCDTHGTEKGQKIGKRQTN